MKRVVLFLLTNIAVMLVLSISARILGIDRFLTSNGLNMGMLLAFAALIGFGGSFISLMMSKTMAKWSTGAQVIERPGNQDEAWLADTVGRLAANAGYWISSIVFEILFGVLASIAVADGEAVQTHRFAPGTHHQPCGGAVPEQRSAGHDPH